MSAEFTLRAMARNYAINNLWDRLDAKACLDAADEIAALRQKLEAAEKDAERWNFYIPKVAEIMGEPVEKIVADIDEAIAPDSVTVTQYDWCPSWKRRDVGKLSVKFRTHPTAQWLDVDTIERSSTTMRRTVASLDRESAFAVYSMLRKVFEPTLK